MTNIRRSNISRREGLRLLAAAGVSTVTLPMLPARAEPKLMVMEWAGYELPEYHAEFAAKHGGSPQYNFFSAEEDALQKLLAGFRADVSHPCTASIGRWRDAGVIRPIDTARIERWSEIIPELFDFKDVQHEGQYWFMPWDWGFSGVGYRTDMVEGREPSFALLTDPSLKGKLAMNSQFDAGLAAAGVIGGFKNPFDPSEEEMAKTPDLFRQLVNNSRFLWSDQTEVEQALASGEVAAGWLWSASVKNLRDQGVPVELAAPIMPWTCGFVLNTESQGSEDQAYDYLNAMLEPQAGAALIKTGYGHANKNAFPLVDAALLKSMGLDDVTALFSQGVPFDAVPQEKRDRLISEWEKAQAGVQ